MDKNTIDLSLGNHEFKVVDRSSIFLTGIKKITSFLVIFYF